jgi:hypothetical protein
MMQKWSKIPSRPLFVVSLNFSSRKFFPLEDQSSLLFTVIIADRAISSVSSYQVAAIKKVNTNLMKAPVSGIAENQSSACGYVILRIIILVLNFAHLLLMPDQILTPVGFVFKIYFCSSPSPIKIGRGCIDCGLARDSDASNRRSR